MFLLQAVAPAGMVKAGKARFEAGLHAGPPVVVTKRLHRGDVRLPGRVGVDHEPVTGMQFDKALTEYLLSRRTRF